MVAPSGHRMMRVPPTAAPGDCAADRLVELLGVRSPKKSASSLQIGALSQTPRQPLTTWTVNSPSAVVSPSAMPRLLPDSGSGAASP